jgi:hypothetical protein
METSTPKPTLILLRVIFWTFWTGALVLPTLSLLGISSRISQYTDVCVIMLSLTSALCVKTWPNLARFGMLTVGWVLMAVLFWLLATANVWLVGTSL